MFLGHSKRCKLRYTEGLNRYDKQNFSFVLIPRGCIVIRLLVEYIGFR